MRFWMQVSSEADGPGILLSLESKDKLRLEEAVAMLQNELPKGIVAETQHDTTSFSR